MRTLFPLLLFVGCQGSADTDNTDDNPDDLSALRETCEDDPEACRWDGSGSRRPAITGADIMSITLVDDVDGDGYDELLVQTQTHVSLVNGPFDEARSTGDATWSLPLVDGSFRHLDLKDVSGDGTVDLIAFDTDLLVFEGPIGDGTSLDSLWDAWT